MRDLNVLRERIEHAERHLKASHSARERESEALMAMWRQIRDRFEGQEKEIARYRAELSELTQANDELSTLVDRLIGSIEGSIREAGGETVPTIAGMAGDLLGSEPPSSKVFEKSVSDRVVAASQNAESITDEPREAELEEDDRPSFESELLQELSDEEVSTPEMTLPATPVSGDSASEGIRDLISRIEGSVAGAQDDDQNSDVEFEEDDEEDPELAKELEEIEALRNELNGLRNKISNGG